MADFDVVAVLFDHLVRAFPLRRELSGEGLVGVSLVEDEVAGLEGVDALVLACCAAFSDTVLDVGADCSDCSEV